MAVQIAEQQKMIANKDSVNKDLRLALTECKDDAFSLRVAFGAEMRENNDAKLIIKNNKETIKQWKRKTIAVSFIGLVLTSFEGYLLIKK